MGTVKRETPGGRCSSEPSQSEHRAAAPAPTPQPAGVGGATPEAPVGRSDLCASICSRGAALPCIALRGRFRPLGHTNGGRSYFARAPVTKKPVPRQNNAQVGGQVLNLRMMIDMRKSRTGHEYC